MMRLQGARYVCHVDPAVIGETSLSITLAHPAHTSSRNSPSFLLPFDTQSLVNDQVTAIRS